MKLALIALLPIVLLIVFALARRREAREAQAAAQARSKSAAARRQRVPGVSNNVKGVTATQTFEPLRPTAGIDQDYVDDR